MKSKKKTKRVKPRIKVAPPSKRHKSVKDYDRKGKNAALDELTKETEDLGLYDSEFKNKHARNKPEDFMKLVWEGKEFKDHQVHNGSLDMFSTHEHSESLKKESQKSWIDSFFAIFGFKRKS